MILLTNFGDSNNTMELGETAELEFSLFCFTEQATKHELQIRHSRIDEEKQKMKMKTNQYETRETTTEKRMQDGRRK